MDTETSEDTFLPLQVIENVIHETDNSQFKKKLTMSFEEYRSLTNMLVIYMRSEEARNEDVSKCNQIDKSKNGKDYDEDKCGIKKSDLVAWYLDKIQDQIDSEEELLDRKSLIEKIIDRLIYQDQIIIPLKETGKDNEEEPMLLAHPRYIIE